MKLLLTSAGITNPSILGALVELLGKPVAECHALFVPTGIYPYPHGGRMAYRAIRGDLGQPLSQLGWKSLGVLELTALASLDRSTWALSVEESDAVLVWGGDPFYIAYWMRHSGVAELLASHSHDLVYVGVSAGSMMTSSNFVEAYTKPPSAIREADSSEEIALATTDGEITRTLVRGPGTGFVDFSVIPHMDHDDHPDASAANAQVWASKMLGPVYAIDDQTAIKVVGGKVEVVSEGNWKLFQPSAGPTGSFAETFRTQ